ncbi:hypothetical protein Tco_1575210 [Tanacetum coccineum]
MDFVSSSNNNTSSTNEVVNIAHGVSTASTQVNAANSTNIDNLSDTVIFLPHSTSGIFMPSTLDLSFTGLDEFVNEPVVENSKAMYSAKRA